MGRHGKETSARTTLRWARCERSWGGNQQWGWEMVCRSQGYAYYPPISSGEKMAVPPKGYSPSEDIYIISFCTARKIFSCLVNLILYNKIGSHVKWRSLTRYRCNCVEKHLISESEAVLCPDSAPGWILTKTLMKKKNQCYYENYYMKMLQNTLCGSTGMNASSLCNPCLF